VTAFSCTSWAVLPEQSVEGGVPVISGDYQNTQGGLLAVVVCVAPNPEGP
jgi:hypothetical protein